MKRFKKYPCHVIFTLGHGHVALVLLRKNFPVWMEFIGEKENVRKEKRNGINIQIFFLPFLQL